MRKIVDRSLRQSGLEISAVLDAGNGAEALAVLAEHRLECTRETVTANPTRSIHSQQNWDIVLADVARELFELMLDCKFHA